MNLTKKWAIILLLVTPLLSMAQFFSPSNNGSAIQAGKLYKQAEKLWKQEKFQEAEKLYFQANKLAPSVHNMTEFAKAKLELGDVKGANKVWDENIKSLIAVGNNFELYLAYYFKIHENNNSGSSVAAIQTMLALLKAPPAGAEKMFTRFPNNGPTMVLNFKTVSEMAFRLGDKNSLLEMQSLLKGFKYNAEPLFFVDTYLQMLAGKYDEAILNVLKVEDKGADFSSSETTARVLLPLLYSFKGDVEKSEEWITKAKKHIFIGDGWFKDIEGRNLLTQKKYTEAITSLTLAMQPRYFLFNPIQKPGKFVNYTLRAQAYEGLKDFINAKKDYNAALVYEADYEPALTGLARLEGRAISERRKDKTPPEIFVLEPTIVSRGLKVTASSSGIMIKGIAKDSFGIKSVSINGLPIFSKEDGNFWGNATLAKGINKITIEATDLAGNLASKVFEIEQITSADALNENIVPVQTKDGRNFALFIASQNYDDASIPSLENPIADAVKLKLILKNSYNFKEENIFTLFNPEVAGFKQQFQQLSESIQPEDNLIIFYAGHGIWVDKEKKGYWLLTDAKRNDQNTWLPNKDVLSMIAGLSSRHTLLITDACFSGSVFKTRSIGTDAPPAVREMSEKISRVAITSGNDTEVPDVSVFMKYLVKALSENKEKYLTAQKMFITQIIEAVMTESKTEPRYGTLELAGHIGGDFIFSKK